MRMVTRLVYRSFGFVRILVFLGSMARGSTRSDVGTPWGGRVHLCWLTHQGRLPLASSLARLLASRRDCWPGAASIALPNWWSVPGVCQVCVGVCQRVPNGEISGGAFLLLLQVPTSPICHQYIPVQPVTPVHLLSPSRCIQWTMEDALSMRSVWNLVMSSWKP